MLKNKNINVNITNSYGATPLIYAVKLNNEDIVKLLLQRDDVNINQNWQ